MSIEMKFTHLVSAVDRYLEDYWQQKGSKLHKGELKLLDSIRYSVYQSGGKRFRPLLSLLTAQALGQDIQKVLPFAASVEFIHTYSLIHDDLPCMDNDDTRRGNPTNHKVYGESVALLAGDALLTEAFCQIATCYAEEPAIATQLIRHLSQAAGVHGMVGGQVIDMFAKEQKLNKPELIKMHQLKTGALIAVAVEGAAMICKAKPAQLESLHGFAWRLGLAFQLADDILDSTPEQIEPGSFPDLLGFDETRAYLERLTQEAYSQLSQCPESAEGLRWLADFNLNRTH